jgi:hypothetical protein
MPSPTDDQLEMVLSLLRGGAGVMESAAHAGLDPVWFDEWLRRPRQKAVAARVKRSIAQADLSDLAIIGSAANTRADAAAGTWQAAKARLEMRRLGERERELLEINAIAGC